MQLIEEANGKGHSRSLASQNSEVLLAAFERSGDDCAFEELVRRHSPAVFATCRQLTRNAHDAEDAAQAVFLTLAVQARTTNGIENVGGWLQQVAKNTSLNLCRSRRRRKAREQREASESSRIDRLLNPHPAQAASLEELRVLLRAEVNELPPKYRLPLILHYFGGMKPQEVAREINCTTQALAVRLFRARKMLAEQLARRGLKLGGATLSLAVAETIINGLAQHVSSTTASASEVSPSSAAPSGGAWAVRIAKLCAGAAMSARFNLAVVGVLVVGTALAQSLREGSDLRLPREWQIRPMLHNAVDRLRGYFQSAPQLPATPTAPTPFTPLPDTDARAHPPVLNLLPPRLGSYDGGSPLPSQAFVQVTRPYRDWMSAATPEAHAATLLPGPVTLTGSVPHAASAYSASLGTPVAGSPGVARSHAEVAVAAAPAPGRTFNACPAGPAPEILAGDHLGTTFASAIGADTSATVPQNLATSTAGIFDPSDFATPRPHHHHTLPPAVVPAIGGTPEPAGLAAFAAAAFALSRRRRRK